MDLPAQTEKPTMTSSPILLSDFTDALLKGIRYIRERSRPDDFTKLTVSQTVSFLAIVYEKVRNAVEYREDHLIRRAAIERIVKRRFALNPDGKNEAENLLRELLWARYFQNGSMGEDDVQTVQSIFDKYIALKKILITGRDSTTQKYLYQFLLDLMTCEIEETLSPASARREATYTYFTYQTLRQKIKIEGLNDDQRDAYFLVAVEKAYRKSDISYQRYHVFITFYKTIASYSNEELTQLATKLPTIFHRIDEMVKNLVVEKLTKFTRKQLPPYLILFDIINKNPKDIESILTQQETLWTKVEMTCREKYQFVKNKLRILAVRSLVYIFVTKMLFALILEFPVSQYLFNEVNMTSIIINSVFPPILMLVIVLFFKLPGEDNTKKIHQRIVDIVDKDETFETRVAYVTKRARVRKPLLVFGFTIFYSLTFLVTLLLIFQGLNMLHFNIVSMALFIFFVSVVSFFSFRIKQVVNEYRVVEKESILTPIVDFFFMPILSLGKFFSNELSKLNFFIVIFDFIIEAPFKLIIEVIEEWISFVKARKEEII